jgi:hypothetical protein
MLLVILLFRKTERERERGGRETERERGGRETEREREWERGRESEKEREREREREWKRGGEREVEYVFQSSRIIFIFKRNGGCLGIF